MHSLTVFSVVAGLTLTLSNNVLTAQAASLYDQCGGIGFAGSSECPPSSKCTVINEYFSQCLPSVANVERAECAAQYGQCGGKGWTGATCCPSGWSCQVGNEWYSQCLQGTANNGGGGGAGASCTVTQAAPTVVVTRTVTSTVSSSTSSRATSTRPATTSTKVTTTTTRASTSTTSRTSQAPSSTAAPAASGFLGGLNIAGFEFGISVWGWSGTYVAPPTSQISHFVNQGVNVIRLPFAWQYMESSPGAGLNAAYFSQYDAYVQEILRSGAHVILDLHNYARWNSGVVGADGPTTAQFASLWSSLAKKYASQSKIIFGLMNEPHDLDAFGGMASWTKQVQAAVNAIRAAGAKTQPILLPGTGWTGAADFLNTNLPALKTVTDPVGGTNLLWFDIHQYLDANTSGTSTECVSDKVSELFAPISAELKRIGRKAFLSEIGGGSTASCELHLKNALAHIKANSAAWQGFAVWAAGSFGPQYELTLTPNGNTDTSIWTKAIKPNLPGSSKRMKKRHSAEQH